jgi:hypothetical protein
MVLKPSFGLTLKATPHLLMSSKRVGHPAGVLGNVGATPTMSNLYLNYLNYPQ